MLFYPVRFAGFRLPGLAPLAALLPRRIQQIPGVMQGGVGWQGIIPSRAAKMGSIAVDKGIAKLGSPADFYQQLEPEAIAEHILATARGDIREVVERIMEREHPRALARPAAAGARGGPRARPAAAARHRARGHRRDRRQHRPAARRQADGDPPHRGAPRAGQPDLPRGRPQGAALHHQLRLLLRLRCSGSRRPSSPRSSPAVVGAADRRRDHRLRHQLAGDLDDLRAGRAAQDRAASRSTACSCAASPRSPRSTARSSPTTSSRSATSATSCCTARASDRTRQMIETALRPAVDRAVGPARLGGAGGGRAAASTTRSASRSRARRSSTR